MKLITASRIAVDKGFERLIKLAKKLNDDKVKFTWDVYGKNDSVYSKIIIDRFPKNVNFKGFDPNVTSKMKKYDYLVQLSDSEGLCYSVAEALSNYVPCIITDFESSTEQITDGENGFILKMNLSDYEKILSKKIILSSYKEKGSEQDWIDIIEG